MRARHSSLPCIQRNGALGPSCLEGALGREDHLFLFSSPNQSSGGPRAPHSWHSRLPATSKITSGGAVPSWGPRTPRGCSLEFSLSTPPFGAFNSSLLRAFSGSGTSFDPWNPEPQRLPSWPHPLPVPTKPVSRENLVLGIHGGPSRGLVQLAQPLFCSQEAAFPPVPWGGPVVWPGTAVEFFFFFFLSPVYCLPQSMHLRPGP